MDDVDRDTTLAPRVMTMRIIVIALLNGILLFMGIAVYTRTAGQMPPPPDTPRLTYLAFLFAAPMVLAAFIVPRVIESAAVRKLAKTSVDTNLDSLVGVFQQRLIIRSALFEGPAFLALIAYMIEGQWPMLVIAGLMAAGIASGFPSVSGLQSWLDERREQIAAERASS